MYMYKKEVKIHRKKTKMLCDMAWHESPLADYLFCDFMLQILLFALLIISKTDICCLWLHICTCI